MAKPVVIITETLDQAAADWLAQRCAVRWVRFDEADAFEQALPDADALIVRTYTRVDAALLARCPKVKVIGRAGVGLDNFDLDACRASNTPVVYTPDANTQAVVEYVLGLMLDHVRPRTALTAQTTPEAFHELRKTEVGRQLDRLTIGIVGMGRIGKRVATVAHALGMNTLATDLLPETQARQACPVPFDYLDHHTLYQRSDIVTLHTDGRPENKHLLSAEAMSHLRPHALLINAARGMLIDHAALADWLQAHPDAHAYLDVHDPEPPPQDFVLRQLSNATLLPHLASRTDTALANMSSVVHDVWAVLQGESPRYPAFAITPSGRA